MANGWEYGLQVDRINKKKKQQIKTCSDCIHENACRIWTDGRVISDESASVCPNHETVKESAAYLCGVLDERKREKTNADSFRAMSNEEQQNFVRKFWEIEDFADWLKQPSKGE